MFNPDGRLMGVLNWITRLLYLQMLWVLFSIIGLVIGGFFPATFTMFAIARKWIRENTDFPLFKTFLQMYKESLIKANILGWFMGLFAFSLYYYYAWFSELTGAIPLVFIGMLIVMGFAFLIVSLFIIPVYAHYDVGLLTVFKYAATTAISHPLHALSMIVTIVAFWYLMLALPIIFMFIGVSLLVCILMVIANAAFVNIERKSTQ